MPQETPGLPRAPWGFFHASNSVTYLLVLTGILGIYGALESKRWQAGAALALASAFDLFDGIFARRFNRTEAQKRFGVQIDSLADSFAFGAVPVVVHTTLSWAGLRGWWLAPAAFYLLCTLTRLGYYNLQTEERGGFVGVPTTMMGLLNSLMLCFPLDPASTAAVLVAGGLAMVAPIPIRRPRPAAFFSVVAIAILLAAWHLSNGFFAQAQ
jgi:CDP-diacylglycerol--serine O-phosphatidyltransferase